MATRNARVILSAEDQATAQIRRVEQALRGGLGGGISYVSGQLGGLGMGFGAATAAIGVFVAAAAATVAMLRPLVQAAADQEEADIRLAAALRTVGADVEATLPVLRDYAGALQTQTAYSDEAIQSGMALLVSIGRLRGEGLERATKAALDLAAGTQTELEPAFRALAKAAAGNETALRKLIGEFGKGQTEAETFERALDRIGEIAGGSAAARIETFRGKVESLSLTWNDMQEILGQPFLEALQVDIDRGLIPLVLGMQDAAETSRAFRSAVLFTASAIHQMVGAAAGAQADLLDLSRPLAVATSKIVGTDWLLGFEETLRRYRGIAAGAADIADELARLARTKPPTPTGRGDAKPDPDADRLEEEAARARRQRAERVHADLLDQQSAFDRARVQAAEMLAKVLEGQAEAQWQQDQVARGLRHQKELADLERSLDEQTRARRDAGAKLTAEEQAAVEANTATKATIEERHRIENEDAERRHQERMAGRAREAAITRADAELQTAATALGQRQALEEAAMTARHAQEQLGAAGNEAELFALASRHAQERKDLDLRFALETQAELLDRELTAMRLRHAAELAEIGLSEEQKAALRAAHRAEEEALVAEHEARLAAAKAAADEAKATRDRAAAEREKALRRQMASEAVGALRELFGKHKAASVALAIIDAFRAAARAYADFPWPWSAVVSGLVLAAGLKNAAEIRRQKFASGGVAQGAAGVDRVPALLTAGELVADTRMGEARAILGGRAAIVPIDVMRAYMATQPDTRASDELIDRIHEDAFQRASGPAGRPRPRAAASAEAAGVLARATQRDASVELHIHGEVLDPEEWFRRNRHGIGRAIRTMLDDGGVR